jgi:hypothetical protein
MACTGLHAYCVRRQVKPALVLVPTFTHAHVRGAPPQAASCDEASAAASASASPSVRMPPQELRPRLLAGLRLCSSGVARSCHPGAPTGAPRQPCSQHGVSPPSPLTPSPPARPPQRALSARPAPNPRPRAADQPLSTDAGRAHQRAGLHQRAPPAARAAGEQLPGPGQACLAPPCERSSTARSRLLPQPCPFAPCVYAINLAPCTLYYIPRTIYYIYDIHVLAAPTDAHRTLRQTGAPSSPPSTSHPAGCTATWCARAWGLPLGCTQTWSGRAVHKHVAGAPCPGYDSRRPL